MPLPVEDWHSLVKITGIVLLKVHSHFSRATMATNFPTLQEFKAQKDAVRLALSSESSTPGTQAHPRLSDFKAQKKGRLELDVANRMAEAATMQRDKKHVKPC